MKPVIALVGRPNVGKSTLFNRFTRTRDAIVADQPGMTRDRKYGNASVNERDMIVIDTDSPRLCPIYDPASAVVYSAEGGDVKDVIVNGRVLMKDRKVLSLDPIEIIGKVREISKRIVGR